MKIRTRYHAFTLLEMTIAMLIAAICMGIAFYVLSLFIQMGEAQQIEKQATFLVEMFQHRMQREILEADRVRFADNTLSMDREDRLTRYIFLDSGLVRSQQDVYTDTLYGHIAHLTIEYMPDLPDEIVQACHFELQTKNEHYPFAFRKVYSAENLVSLPTE